jgi:MFS family permease
MDDKPSRWPFYYGWMIVILAFISIGIWLSLRTTFSVFLVALLDEYRWTHAATAGVQSVALLVYTFSAPLVGGLIDRFGPRKVILPGILVSCAGLASCAYVRTLPQLYLVYGVVVALGATSISIVAYSAILSNWFEKRRGLASGIAVSGMGLGTFALVPLSQYIINMAGWRSAYLALGALSFVLLFPLTAWFLRHRPGELGLQPDGGDASAKPEKRSVEVVDPDWAKTDWTLRRVSREKRFWALLMFSFLIIVPLYVVLIHVAGLLVGRGFSRMDAAFVIAFLGVASSVFKIFWGWLSDRIGREITFTMGAVALALGILWLLIVDAGGPSWLVYAFVLFAGCGWGVTAPTFMSVAADLFQGRSFGLVYGINEGVLGLGSALGPWLGGFVYDTTGTYHMALVIAIGAAMASCPFAWMSAPRKVRRCVRRG